MPHRLIEFAEHVHDLLAADPGPAGRERVRVLLESLLQDQEFAAEHLGDEQPQKRVLYEDPELGFAILGHVYHEPRRTKPHDHGSAWAIYGQVSGESLMDDWEIVEPASAERRGKVRLLRSYRLIPGHAHLYNEGDLHSPRRNGPAKLIRIEGQLVERLQRFSYEPA